MKISDPYFRVELLEKTPNPQRLIWISQHQCVCEGAAIDDPAPPEEKAGKYVVEHLLKGDRGHYSPLEAAQISFNVIGFNHRTMQQATRHRVAVHWSVQSFRYTGDRVAKLGGAFERWCIDQGVAPELAIRAGEAYNWIPKNQNLVDEVFYLRPVGTYRDREGDPPYKYTESDRLDDVMDNLYDAWRYYQKVSNGMPPEMAAGRLPMDARQNLVCSFNVRSLMHFLDLRTPANAQSEIRVMCDLMWPYFESWVPAIAEWYRARRFGKARLSP